MPYQKFNNGRAASVTPSDTEKIPNPEMPTATVSATNATIVILNGAVVSVSLAASNAGSGYSLIGTLAASISGSPGSGATLLPNIGANGTIYLTVTAGGSGYTDGTYTSGSTYTLSFSGSGTVSNNVNQAQPAEIWALPNAAGDRIQLVTAGGDDINFTIPIKDWFKVPVQCIQVKSTGTSASMTAIAVW